MTRAQDISKLAVFGLALSALALNGCSYLGGPKTRWVEAKPVQSRAERTSREDAYYQSAVFAISRRDYMGALDMLQAARQANPSDVRVLNAFGVVYDKLGRFDLSARYYAQAAALDPKSPIVQANRTYSAKLSGVGAAQETLLAAAPAPAAAPAGTSPAPADAAPPATPGAAVVAQAAQPSAPAAAATPALALRPALSAERASVLRIGAPVYILDSSGPTGAGEQVRVLLAKRGWTTPKWALQSAPQQPNTTIYYATQRLMVAKGLAATLPGPARLAPCDKCSGIRLVLGKDAARWRFGASSAPVKGRMGA